jgi:branched-chain amino acid transport system permease protein
VPYSTIPQQLLNGLTLGSVYALIALGYTLIFGVMRTIFFAQGDLCMVGALGALAMLRWVHPHGILILPVAIAGALIASVLAGLAAERFAMRPLRSAPRTKQLIASLGVSMILQNMVLLWVSSGNLIFPAVVPAVSWTVGAVTVTSESLMIVVGALVLMIGLELFVNRTRLGLHLQAVAESQETAELDGIRIDRTMALTFLVGSVFAAVAGVMLGSYYGVAKYDMGFVPGIKGFTAAILGGFGQPRGAVIGGIILGLSESFVAGFISSTYKDLLAFAILVLVLIVRPRGLLGQEVRQ